MAIEDVGKFYLYCLSAAEWSEPEKYHEAFGFNDFKKQALFIEFAGENLGKNHRLLKYGKHDGTTFSIENLTHEYKLDKESLYKVQEELKAEMPGKFPSGFELEDGNTWERVTWYCVQFPIEEWEIRFAKHGGALVKPENPNYPQPV